MTVTHSRSILVATDYSLESELALTQAFELASADDDIEVHVVHVIQGPMHDVVFSDSALSRERELLRNHVQSYLDAYLARQLGSKPPARVVCHVRAQQPAEGITQLAAELHPELIVVGSHGRRGVRRALMGSVAELVVRLAPCPVLVARARAAAPMSIPRIEPPCPRCVDVRRLSAGQQLWCAQHLERHGQRHTYHQRDRLSTDHNFPLVCRY